MQSYLLVAQIARKSVSPANLSLTRYSRKPILPYMAYRTNDEVSYQVKLLAKPQNGRPPQDRTKFQPTRNKRKAEITRNKRNLYPVLIEEIRSWYQRKPFLSREEYRQSQPSDKRNERVATRKIPRSRFLFGFV